MTTILEALCEHLKSIGCVIAIKHTSPNFVGFTYNGTHMSIYQSDNIIEVKIETLIPRPVTYRKNFELLDPDSIDQLTNFITEKVTSWPELL